MRSLVVSCVARKPPWPEKEGVVRRLWARVPRTKVARCVCVCDSFPRTTLRVSSSAYTRENLRKTCSSYSLAKPHPLLVMLALCGCGLRLRGATSAIKECCLLYQCSSHLLTLSIHIQCCVYTYRERATKHARMQSARATRAKRWAWF